LAPYADLPAWSPLFHAGGNAPNSLFMPAQLSLAIQAGLSIPAVMALQHVSGTSMSLFSPVRMSIAAGLSGGHGQERSVYAQVWPFLLLGLVLLLAMAAMIVSSFPPSPMARPSAPEQIERAI
jgi:lactate permease